MIIHKRSSAILLLLFFCFAFSGALFAQATESLEKLIRVDVQPFMTQGELAHGYYVFRCKIQNLDVKPHNVSLTCDKVAKKSFELQPGETINASLPLPVTNLNFGEAVQIQADNIKLPPVSHHMLRAVYTSPSYHHPKLITHGPVTYAPDEETVSSTFLICRSLRKQFTETKCIFAEKDCQYWPQDRMDYSCLDFILLTPSELALAPEAVQTALKQYVLSGGVLWLFDSDAQKNDLDKINWIAEIISETSSQERVQKSLLKQYNVGFGIVALTNRAVLEDLYNQNNSNNEDLSDSEQFTSDSDKQELGKSDAEILNELYNQFDVKPSWFENNTVDDWHTWFPVVNDLSIPVLGICIVILLFVLLAGPVNLFLLNKYKKRVLLLATVPILSFLFAGTILLYVLLSDGFNTDARISSGACLDQRDGSYSALILYGVYARTSPRNVVFDSDEELNITDAGQEDQLNIDWTSGKQVMSSHFVPVRRPAYYKIRKAGTTRLKLDFDFNSPTPYVVNGLGKDVEQMFVCDKDGNLWKAEHIEAGQKATLSPVIRQYYNKSSKDELLSDCISSPRWDFNDRVYNAEKIAGMLRPGNYIATFASSGPFANKGIPYAKEKESFAFLLGRFE